MILQSSVSDVDALVMSPALFAERPIPKPVKIEGHTLLASETRPGDWENWPEAPEFQHLAGLPQYAAAFEIRHLPEQQQVQPHSVVEDQIAKG